MSPANAYRISGFFIAKCSDADDRQALLYYRNNAISELCAKVNKVRSAPKGSPYTAKCRDYIRKHFREKIYVEDIAAALGISEGYLSRLFRKETGTSIQDYVNQVRVDRAADLLIYSDLSLPDIVSYVHFPTQSYFRKMFKQYKNMTPNAFRKQHRVGEV